MTRYTAPLRISLSSEALVSNWRWLATQSGAAACGAAVKANGYGLGAVEVVTRLRKAGCRDFFVATWAEAAELSDVIGDANLSVLHGVREADMGLATTLNARPVLNSTEQIARWRALAAGPCGVMVDTGMNRLGLRVEEALGGALDGLTIETLMSHLASADEDNVQNGRQLKAFTALRQTTSARRYSLANSAGICLGSDYAFDLTRPGLALYGGVARAESAGFVRQVAFPQAQVLQVRDVRAGETVGYGATWTAPSQSRVAIVNLGYADGYLRTHAGSGGSSWNGDALPVVGRVSMDLLAFDAGAASGLSEGDWLTIDYDLPTTAATSGLSQYELLTGLGQRFDRCWG